eukprot:CAMPEP_0118945682 /NCGR_PEP_ID=MMETSP1169-20130426/42743_1 /TAXON_ID=36882 /ORGANISM="Pyramimonas obovata, Strain CCMP722" /LENGTH=89 /DNA_ID=CAMNT_0006891451 /DNA_START=313 /DNA_END=580 /DNA_ORIENTATION=+
MAHSSGTHKQTDPKRALGCLRIQLECLDARVVHSELVQVKDPKKRSCKPGPNPNTVESSSSFTSRRGYTSPFEAFARQTTRKNGPSVFK